MKKEKWPSSKKTNEICSATKIALRAFAAAAPQLLPFKVKREAGIKEVLTSVQKWFLPAKKSEEPFVTQEKQSFFSSKNCVNVFLRLCSRFHF